MATFTHLIPYVQIALSILLVAVILMQKSTADSGGAFGGSGNWNAGYHTRRGFEKVLFDATIVLAALFVVTSLTALFVR